MKTNWWWRWIRLPVSFTTWLFCFCGQFHMHRHKNKAQYHKNKPRKKNKTKKFLMQKTCRFSTYRFSTAKNRRRNFPLHKMWKIVAACRTGSPKTPAVRLRQWETENAKLQNLRRSDCWENVVGGGNQYYKVWNSFFIDSSFVLFSRPRNSSSTGMSLWVDPNLSLMRGSFPTLIHEARQLTYWFVGFFLFFSWFAEVAFWLPPPPALLSHKQNKGFFFNFFSIW
jgi:hypothetical protein